MQRVNLENRKSQTRREANLKEINEHPDDWRFLQTLMANKKKGTPLRLYAQFVHKRSGELREFLCPYGKPNTVLYVRENFDLSCTSENAPWLITYKAGGQREVKHLFDDPEKEKDYFNRYRKDPSKPRPSIHMPRLASRTWLVVKEIRVERLDEISTEDAKAEGIEEVEPGKWKNYLNGGTETFPENSFFSLFESLYGGDEYYRPWVWVVHYEILTHQAPLEGGYSYSALHRPTGECWRILGIDLTGGRVCAAGWPPSIGKLSDCRDFRRKEKLTDKELNHRKKEFGHNWL